MSGPRMGMSQMNGSSNRRPSNMSRVPSGGDNKPPISGCAQHDELIKYIYDSWSKVESDRGSQGGGSVIYYQEQENHLLKDFQPFDLEAYWGRRVVQMQQPQHS